MTLIQPRWLPGLSAGRIVKTALLALSVAAASPVASAQFGGYGSRGRGLSSRDHRQFEDVLMLDDGQREVVHLLFEDYSQGMQEITRQQLAQQDALFKAMSEGTSDQGEKQQRTIDKVAKERLDLETQFIDDVRALLSEEQAVRWPNLQRAIRRNQSAPLGLLSGERADLIRVVSQIELSEASRTLVSPLLDQYEVEFDRALLARYEGQIQTREKVQEVWQSGDRNMVEMENLSHEMIEFSVRVREVNRRFAREIEGQLAGEEQARFNDAFNRASFPEVFKPSRAQRTLDLVLGFDNLSSEQRSTVEEIGARFRRSTSILNEQHMAAISELEDSMKWDEWDRYLIGAELKSHGDREETPWGKVEKTKRELIAKAIESIKRALNEGQVATLEDQLAKIREQERE